MIVIKFLEFLNTVKLYHWKTLGYSVHKATDELHSKLSDNVDKFVEVFLGKINNRIDLSHVKTMEVSDFTHLKDFVGCVNKFKEYITFLENNEFIKSIPNTDLLTIRDEMLININQFLYLSTLS